MTEAINRVEDFEVACAIRDGQLVYLGPPREFRERVLSQLVAEGMYDIMANMYRGTIVFRLNRVEPREIIRRMGLELP